MPSVIDGVADCVAYGLGGIGDFVAHSFDCISNRRTGCLRCIFDLLAHSFDRVDDRCTGIVQCIANVSDCLREPIAHDGPTFARTFFIGLHQDDR